MGWMRYVMAGAAFAAPMSAAAAETGALVRFVACPVYRDTDSGRKSGCWLAQDRASGTRYDVSLSPHKPDWNYAVLVEGKVSAEAPTACGSPVLAPVRTSRLYDMPCTRHMLPAEGFAGRRYKLPRRNISPSSVARPVPPGPYAERVFPVYFEYGNDFLIYQYDDWLIDQAVTWIQAAKPARLIITGYAATQPETVSGVTIAEPESLALQRAQTIATTMERMVPGLKIEVRADTHPAVTQEAEADGLPWQSQRRVEMRAVF